MTTACENLYGSLGYNIPTEDLTNEDKQFLVDIVPTLSAETKETIYFLVLHDHTKSNPNTKVVLPYKSKQLTNDKVEIKIDALPIRLKWIIYKFCKFEAKRVNPEVAEN